MSGIGKLRPEVKDAWVAALRSDEYQQGHGRLHLQHQGEDLFCCLGVLCDLAAKVGVTTASYRGLRGDGYGGMIGLPPTEVEAWAYEDRPGMDAYWQVVESDGLGLPSQRSLAEINDAGADFGHIADLIEASL